MDYSQEIKERLDTREVFAFYGFERNRKGFVCCPFHSEKTASCKVYDGQRGYHCFGCGATGDVLTFVKNYFGISFPETLSKLNDDFCLGLPIKDKQITEAEKIELARKEYERKKKAKKEREQREKAESDYWKAFDEVVRLDKMSRPKPEFAEMMTPQFLEYLSKKDEAFYRLGEAEKELMKYEH